MALDGLNITSFRMVFEGESVSEGAMHATFKTNTWLVARQIRTSSRGLRRGVAWRSTACRRRKGPCRPRDGHGTAFIAPPKPRRST
jgi:hypothetical protein